MIDKIDQYDKQPSNIKKFFYVFDNSIEFLGRLGWRATRDKVTGTWKFVQPIAMKGKDVITKDGWKLIKTTSNNTWQIVYPKVVNGKTMPVINGTKYTFKLVKD